MAKWTPQSTNADVADFSDDPLLKRMILRHRIAIVGGFLAVAAIVGFGAKPTYLWFRENQINRNLEAAKAAARLEDWGDARNKARSVLLARPGDFEAYRVWYKALSKMGEPRTYMVAAVLFMDKRSTPEDRIDALAVMAQQAPQAVALSAFASLDKDLQNATATRVAIAPLLLKRGEISLVENMIREVPDLEANPQARLTLLRALCGLPTRERVTEARAVFSQLVAEHASEQSLEALLVLGETPGGLAPGEGLPPLLDWVEAQPGATTLHKLLAFHPSIESLPEAAEGFYEKAIKRFIDVDPGTLGTWLIRHNQTSKVADLLAEPSKLSANAYIARLHALLREKRTAEITAALAEPPASSDLVELELVKAAVANMQGNSAAETNAWNKALVNAAFDQSRNRFLEIGKYAATLGATKVIDDTWVAAVRIGWGQIPIYKDMLPVFASLAQQGRSEDMLAMYRTLLRFEPQNPELINNYNYLALLNGVASPASAARELEQLVGQNPELPEFRSALAMALLLDGKADLALAQVPELQKSKRVSPLMIRALQGSALLVKGEVEPGRALMEGIDWRRFMGIESLAFRRLLTSLQIKDLPLPPMELTQLEVDPETVPAWKKVVERLEKERSQDVLPALPAPVVPGMGEIR